MHETRKSYCRVCHNYCALEVDVEDGRAVAVRGDASDPIYGGYTCIKGRQLPELLRHEDRILRPLRRRGDAFEEIPSERALDEIAERVSRIVEEYGPRAVASYCGTHAFQNSAALAVAMPTTPRTWAGSAPAPTPSSRTSGTSTPSRAWRARAQSR